MRKKRGYLTYRGLYGGHDMIYVNRLITWGQGTERGKDRYTEKLKVPVPDRQEKKM